MDIKIILTVIFSGAFLSFVQFLIQFFITRKDTKEKEAKEDKLECLRKELQESIKQREETGNEHFEIHKEAIANISKDYQENFEKLYKSLEQLRNENSKVADALDKIAQGQDVFSTGLLGLTHFELIYITDIIKARKHITLSEKAILDSLYEPYIQLGGNGQTKKNYEYVMTFPVISDEEAHRMDSDIAADNVKNHWKS